MMPSRRSFRTSQHSFDFGRESHSQGSSSKDGESRGGSFKRSRRYSSSSSSSFSNKSGFSSSSDGSYGRNEESPPSHVRSPPSTLTLSQDAETELMLQRKRALALGNFRFFYRSGTGVSLEDTRSFRQALRASSGLRYVKVPPGFETSNYPKTRYAKLKGKNPPLPGLGEHFNVVWSLPKGELAVDYSVKLYDFNAIQSAEIECESKSPKSPWFGLIDPRAIPTVAEKVDFDANVFWTVAFLFKHFHTCGVQAWDNEIQELKGNYLRNEISNRRRTLPPIPIGSSSPQNESFNKSPEKDRTATMDMNDESGCRYTGCVTEWRGSFGFLSCTLIQGRIFLHVSDILWPSEYQTSIGELPIGASVNFMLTLDAQNRYKALDGRLFV